MGTLGDKGMVVSITSYVDVLLERFSNRQAVTRDGRRFLVKQVCLR